MKKIFYFLIVFLCVFSFNLTSTYAKTCSQYQFSECPAVDDEGTACIATHGACTASTKNDGSDEKLSWLNTGDEENKVTCGDNVTIHKSIPKTTSLIVTVISIIAPAMLAIMGAIDFYKAVMSGKEENIQKNQKAFVARIISAIILFLVIVLAKIFVSLMTNVLGTGAGSTIIRCVDCFVSNKCG